MDRFSEGDRVRVDIPDETDPDYERYHGIHGCVVAVLIDDADSVTGDTRDTHVYRVDLDTGKKADFRWRDLRPPLDDSPNA
jgi:ribosomal protein L21E